MGVGNFFSILFSVVGLVLLVVPIAICALLGYFVSKETRRANAVSAGIYGAAIGLMLILFSATGKSNSYAAASLGLLIFIGVIIMVIRFFPFLKALRLKPQIQEQRRAQEQYEHDHDPSVMFANAVNRFGIAPAKSGENSFRGYRLVNSDGDGTPDPIYEQARHYKLSKARNAHQLFGNPGVGLKSSDFGASEVYSGAFGEQILAKIIASSGLNVISFWSLYGKDERGSSTDADIDSVIVGMGRNGQLYAWFVDAKNYKGGSDTAYVNIADDTLARISKSKHAFVSGSDGRADLHMSTNMVAQYLHWRPYLEQFSIQSDWLVCMVPTSDSGTPSVQGVEWPGGVPAVTPNELLARIRSLDLVDTANIPLNVINFFNNSVKPTIE